jgi:hypothetical protein
MNKKLSRRLAMALLGAAALWIFVRQTAGARGAAEGLAARPEARYQWRQENAKAPFSASYNYPLFNVRNKLWAFHPEGNWNSEDGKTWIKAELPPSGLNTAFQRYVQFGDAIYALGAKEGNYPDLKLGSRIARTTDFKKWEVIAETSELPLRVFYTSVVFTGKIWLIGGTDGKKYYNDVWNSSDAVHWTRVAEHAQWEARTGGSAVVFNGKIWLIGGSIIDGPGFHDVWSSTDGITWGKVSETAKGGGAYSAVVYDDKIWIVGANRNDGSFGHSVFVTSDGVNWAAHSAPWAPRGAAAACVYEGKLFMTGGKYSTTENGNIHFIYYNDVWHMSRSQ